jgi:hypothetical protein
MIRAGECRHCRCSESSPCKLPNGDTCMWIDKTRTVCSSPSCVKAETARRSRIDVASRPRKLTPAEVHLLIRGRKLPKRERAAKTKVQAKR